MTNDDKFHHNERITAMHETFGKTVTARTLELYWQALASMPLADFDAAFSRSIRESRRPATPIELREFARDSRKTQEQRRETEYLCHFHGDGQFERSEQGRPNHPSTNRTVWWCARCTHFVKQGQQKADLQMLPGAPALVRSLAEAKS